MNMEKGEDFLKAQYRLFSVSCSHTGAFENIPFISVVVLFASIPRGVPAGQMGLFSLHRDAALPCFPVVGLSVMLFEC